MFINEDSPCTVCEKKGFICTNEDKIRGPKTEQRTRSNGKSPSTSEVPAAGQFVFSVNLPSSMQPAEPIRMPNNFRDGEYSLMDQPSETFLNTNLLQASADEIVDGSTGYTRNSGRFYRNNDAKRKLENDDIPWDDRPASGPSYSDSLHGG